MKKPERPSVVALILTYDDADIVRSCIRSVQHSDYPNLSVFLIDNGSRADVAGAIRQAMLDVQIIALPENVGYAGGFNSAMKQIYRDCDGEVDYFWILNNDLEVATDTLSRLMEVIEGDDTIGFVGPETFRRHGHGEHDQWITRRGHPENPGDILLDNELDCHGVKKVEVEFVVGHCMLVRAHLLRSVGMMREFVIYWEEREWQWRAKQHGWKCYVVPGSLAFHDRDSFGKPLNTYFRTRNYIFFNRLVLRSNHCFRRYFLKNLYNEIKGAIAMSLRRQWSLQHSANFIRCAPGRAKRWRVVRGSLASRGVKPLWAGGVRRTAGRPRPAKQINAPVPSTRGGLGSPVAVYRGPAHPERYYSWFCKVYSKDRLSIRVALGGRGLLR